MGLPPWYRFASMGFCCATSPVVAGAIRTREWPLSGVFVVFNRQYVRSAHCDEVWDFFRREFAYKALFPPWWPWTLPDVHALLTPVSRRDHSERTRAYGLPQFGRRRLLRTPAAFFLFRLIARGGQGHASEQKGHHYNVGNETFWIGVLNNLVHKVHVYSIAGLQFGFTYPNNNRSWK